MASTARLNWDAPGESKKRPPAEPELFVRLDDPDEQQIYNALGTAGSVSVDELALKTGLPVGRISAASLAMEIGGLLRRTPGNMLEKV